ncbi:hypothetical protein KAH55_07250, partial [bacterium]|nr:hypothetical protein [bacterium]
GRLQILLKKNPNQEIYHTVQVERNGFIHSMLTGTALENRGYAYYGDRVYSDWIQLTVENPTGLQISLRSLEAKTGSDFMREIQDLPFVTRQEKIFREIQSGNIPAFLRNIVPLTAEFTDAGGNQHQVRYQVMPDYLAIGSDIDFCRIPMGPRTAQQIADWFGAVLPTPKLVDDIYQQARIKLEPVSYWPVGDANEKVKKFVRHNTAIEEQRFRAGGKLGQLMAGTKKDVVISGKIADPKRPDHVVIYGWHKLDGTPIQPETNIHFDYYVDYSHGIRLVNAVIKIDNQLWNIHDALQDSLLFRLLCDEEQPISQPRYPLE